MQWVKVCAGPPLNTRSIWSKSKRLSGALGSVPALVSAMPLSLISTQSAPKLRAPRAFLDASEGLTLSLITDTSSPWRDIRAGAQSAPLHFSCPCTGRRYRKTPNLGCDNTIDFPGMRAGLQELGYGGLLALEYVGVLEGLQSYPLESAASRIMPEG
jgi:hypothetical protein